MKRTLVSVIIAVIIAIMPVCIAEDTLPEFPFPHNATFGMSPHDVTYTAVMAGAVKFDVLRVYPDDTIFTYEEKTGADGLNYMLISNDWPIYDNPNIRGVYVYFDADNMLDQLQITYKTYDPEDYVLINNVLIEKYGETAFNVTTGLTLPLPQMTLTIEEDKFLNSLHPACFTLLNGQSYENYIVVCEAWHQWLIPYDDTFVVVDHTYIRFYDDAETPTNQTYEYLTFTLLDETERDYLIENMSRMSAD